MRHLIDRIESAVGTRPLTESVKSYNDFVQEGVVRFLEAALPLVKKVYMGGKTYVVKGGRVKVWSGDNAAGLKYEGQNAAGAGMSWWCQLLRDSMFKVTIDVRWFTEDEQAGMHDYTFHTAVHELEPQELADEFAKAFNGTA